MEVVDRAVDTKAEPARVHREASQAETWRNENRFVSRPMPRPAPTLVTIVVPDIAPPLLINGDSRATRQAIWKKAQHYAREKPTQSSWKTNSSVFSYLVDASPRRRHILMMLGTRTA